MRCNDNLGCASDIIGWLAEGMSGAAQMGNIHCGRCVADHATERRNATTMFVAVRAIFLEGLKGE